MAARDKGGTGDPNLRDYRDALSNTSAGYKPRVSQGGVVGGYPAQTDEEYMGHELKSLTETASPDKLSGAGNYDKEQKTPKPLAKPSSFAHGGTVEKTGMALVHKGETVVPKEKNMHDMYGLAKEGMSGHEDKPAKVIHHIRTRKTANGGHVHEHHHTMPDVHPMEEHATMGDDAMADHMMEHMGSPNPGEAEADMGQSGIPTGAPMPQGA